MCLCVCVHVCAATTVAMTCLPKNRILEKHLIFDVITIENWSNGFWLISKDDSSGGGNVDRSSGGGGNDGVVVVAAMIGYEIVVIVIVLIKNIPSQ